MGRTVIGVYGGVGAGLLGAKWGGFEPIFNHEPRDFFSLQTWNHNFPGVGWSPKLKPTDHRPTLVVGNPSCNQFSVSSNKKKYVIDSETIKQTDIFKCFRVLEIYKPEYFIIENIPTLGKRLNLGQTGVSFDVLPERIFLKDYKISITQLNGQDFGVPQRRRRIFIVGCRKECKTPVKLTKFREGGKYEVGFTVYEGFEGLTAHTPNMEIPYHSQERIKKIGELKAEESYYNAQNNRRLNIRKPSPVVTSSASRAIHPTEDRVLTIRETARLMGYPDDFIFYGGIIDMLDQVGKAVIPQVIFSISLDILKHRKENAV